MRMGAGTWWNMLLEVVFPTSARAKRVAQRHDPLPTSPAIKKLLGRNITVLASYEDERVRDAICALKFERDKHSLELLAQLLNDALVEQLSDEASFGRKLIAVPVPLSTKRLASRGMNQVMAILDHTELARSGALTVLPALVRVRDTLQQSTLPREKRLENVRDAFAPVPKYLAALHGATALIIDDVATTGATLSAAAEALEKEGVHVELVALAG